MNIPKKRFDELTYVDSLDPEMMRVLYSASMSLVIMPNNEIAGIFLTLALPIARNSLPQTSWEQDPLPLVIAMTFTKKTLVLLTTKILRLWLILVV